VTTIIVQDYIQGSDHKILNCKTSFIEKEITQRIIGSNWKEKIDWELKEHYEGR